MRLSQRFFGPQQNLREVRLNERHTPGDARKCFQCAIQLGPGMFTGQDQTNTRFAFGHRGKRDSCAQNAFVEERARKLHCGSSLANNYWSDRGLCCGGVYSADVEAGLPQFRLEVASVLPEAVNA